MRKKFVQFVVFVLILTMLPVAHVAAFPYIDGTYDPNGSIPPWLFDQPVIPGETLDSATGIGSTVSTVPTQTSQTISVGLYYGTDTLPAANLQNFVGTGFRFGYLSNGAFVQVGTTQETSISVLKTQNLYYSSSLPGGGYGYSDQITSNVAVGCYHLELNQVFSNFQEAQMTAATINGGFPAWIEGTWRVRIGAYTNRDEAVMMTSAYPNTSLVGTSSYGITVVKTGSSQPIFQFDGNAGTSRMVINPGLDDSVKPITWFKGNKYYGSFRYERSDAGNLAVINLVDLEDYVDCVISREMNNAWPIEALRAQAVAARSYALTRTGHSTFNVCYSEHCQAYYGMGTTGDNTALAAASTAGLCAHYNGEIAETVYHSSDGGATESCENVWFKALPFLRGVIDPYEAMVTDKIHYDYNWTKTYTGLELAQRLNSVKAEYACTEIVDVRVTQTTPTGNVFSVSITDRTGKVIELKKDSVRTVLGLKSLRFSIGDQGPGYSLANGENLPSLNGAWTIDGNGNMVPITGGAIYAATGSGTVAVDLPGVSSNNGIFEFHGTGRGHNLGMSQYGAYAMALQGFTYQDILKFYFTGIEIY